MSIEPLKNPYASSARPVSSSSTACAGIGVSCIDRHVAQTAASAGGEAAAGNRRGSTPGATGHGIDGDQHLLDRSEFLAGVRQAIGQASVRVGHAERGVVPGAIPHHGLRLHPVNCHRGSGGGIIFPDDKPTHRKHLYRAMWESLGYTLLGDDLEFGEEWT